MINQSNAIFCAFLTGHAKHHRVVIFCVREVNQICKTMSNAFEIDPNVASFFDDSGDEESFEGLGEGRLSSDNDLDFEGLDVEENVPGPKEAQVPQPSNDTDKEQGIKMDGSPNRCSSSSVRG